MWCLSFLQKITKLLTKCIQGGEWVLITKIYSGVFYAKKICVCKNENLQFLYFVSFVKLAWAFFFLLLLPDVKGVCMMWSGVSVVGILRKIKSQVIFLILCVFWKISISNVNFFCYFLRGIFWKGIFLLSKIWFLCCVWVFYFISNLFICIFIKIL